MRYFLITYVYKNITGDFGYGLHFVEDLKHPSLANLNHMLDISEEEQKLIPIGVIEFKGKEDYLYAKGEQ